MSTLSTLASAFALLFIGWVFLYELFGAGEEEKKKPSEHSDFGFTQAILWLLATPLLFLGGLLMLLGKILSIMIPLCIELLAMLYQWTNDLAVPLVRAAIRTLAVLPEWSMRMVRFVGKAPVRFAVKGLRVSRSLLRILKRMVTFVGSVFLSCLRTSNRVMRLSLRTIKTFAKVLLRRIRTVVIPKTNFSRKSVDSVANISRRESVNNHRLSTYHSNKKVSATTQRMNAYLTQDEPLPSGKLSPSRHTRGVWSRMRTIGWHTRGRLRTI